MNIEMSSRLSKIIFVHVILYLYYIFIWYIKILTLFLNWVISVITAALYVLMTIICYINILWHYVINQSAY